MNHRHDNMNETKLKTRFCPSPTGYMHLGNARTALFSALLAHSQEGGKFLLRIEDTDLERSKPEFTAGLKEDLRWLGLQWDEGPDEGGDAGPYYQSERQDIYDQYYHKLEEQGLVYPCFCSPDELELSRKLQRAASRPPRYAGTCRGLSQEEINKKLEMGVKPTLRFVVKDSQLIVFEDLVRGKQRFNGVDIGDFIIRRADGSSPFMYVNAIDDALMGVTHVMRGEDHLTNSPRQILILQALGLPMPQYAHISLIVGTDGSPLSKRHGSRSIKELREEGYLSDAIVNYLARLGHNYEDEHYMPIKELAQKFSVKNCGRAPAKYDPKQLIRWQNESVQKLNFQEMKKWVGDSTLNKVPEEKKELFWDTIKPNVQFPKDVEEWIEIIFGTGITLDEEQKNILNETGPEFFNQAKELVEKNGEDYTALKNGLQESLNIKGKKLFQPLRIALTGQLHGPELENILKLLGEETVIKRFSNSF